MPAVQVGGVTAQVTYAGVIQPGLYQVNVTIPNTAPNGDNVTSATYGGATTPAGDLITVQR
jgi:uncharacterized protein (TIGR03437 family)